MKLLVSGAVHNIHSPKREGDVGFDLCANEFRRIPPLVLSYIKTGVFVKLPADMWGMIIARSSTKKQRGLFCPPGVHVDPGYTGELSIPLYNFGAAWHPIGVGDRLAQLVLFPAFTPQLERVHELPKTARGSQGFGSTGT